MTGRIIDSLFVIGILTFLLIKHRNNLSWFSLVIILLALRMIFNVAIMYHGIYSVFEVETLNFFGGTIHWLSIWAILYYSLKGEAKWKI